MVDDNTALLLQVSADISRLEKQFQKASGIVDKQSTFMERRAKQMAQKLESASKVDFSKALDNVFDSSRLKVMDSGIARIGLFGSALEPLGPLGIAAAAGIAAVGAALAGARQAAAFADDISDTANRLHVTTDALQEYRYAIRAAGGEMEGADEALESFSVTLGKAQQGLAKSLKGFLALGFTKEQINGFKDADTALTAVTEKIAGLSNIQQDAIIQQLGLDGLKPLIAAGVDEMARLRNEAHKVGVVMDSELVKRGGELNDQFETVQQVIDVQLKSALVDLGPILVGLLGILGDMAKVANVLVDSFRSIENKTTQGLKTELNRKIKQYNGAGFTPSAGDAAALLNPVTAPQAGARIALDATRSKKLLQQDIQRLEAEIVKRSTQDAPVVPKPILPGANKDKSSSSPKDNTDALIKQANSTEFAANRALLQALLNLTDDVNTRAEIQKKIQDAEQAQLDSVYAAEKARIDGDKTISAATKTQLLAKLKAARDTQTEADAVERRGIDAKTMADLDAKRLDLHRKIADGDIAELQDQADKTRSRKERRRLELEILARQKKLDDEGRANDLADKQRRANAASADGSSVVLVNDGSIQRAADKKYAVDKNNRLESTQGPLAEYLDSIKSLDDAMQDAAVDGLQSLNQGIADLVVNGGDAGDVLKNVLNRVLNDLVNSQLQSGEKALFSALGFADGRVPGYASGRVSGPGTGTSDSILAMGDKGPIRISDGESIINARSTKKYGALLQAINADTLSGYSTGRVPDISQFRSAESGRQNIKVDVGVTTDQNGNLAAYVKSVSTKISQSISASHIDNYDKQMPNRVAQISNNPRDRR